NARERDRPLDAVAVELVEPSTDVVLDGGGRNLDPRGLREGRESLLDGSRQRGLPGEGLEEATREEVQVGVEERHGVPGWRAAQYAERANRVSLGADRRTSVREARRASS